MTDHQEMQKAMAFLEVEENNCSAVPVVEADRGSAIINSPIISSYNDRIRPLLDCVDKLRNINVTQEGIQLPTIVVVGDQSSGKSSVLESLAGISLPRGQGICTRVPLIMRLQSHNSPQAEMSLEFNGKIISTDEDGVADAIALASDEIAGRSKGISNNPLTLTVKKSGVPDVTMVDLPGITRVPVHGQPEDIYEQVSSIIMEYIKPEESIILNVLSATVDFSTCESIRMSQKVDKTGERTLAVVTKPDRSPEGLYEKVTADDVNIGLGYVVVRNRIGVESYEDARAEESLLFQTHPLLSKISKSMVGIPILAQRLVQIQATIISKSLPEIIRKINEKLNSNLSELGKMPQHFTSIGEATRAFMHILSTAKESLKKIFIRGEFDEFPNDKQRHCTARLVEMLAQYSAELQENSCENEPKEDFLKHEIDILEESKGIWLPNFLPRSAFMASLQIKVNSVSSIPVEFLNRVWSYVESVLSPILVEHSENFPQLQSYMRKATQALITKEEEKSANWFMEIIEMEKIIDYTCQPEYITEWNNLMTKQDEFIQIVSDYDSTPIVSDYDSTPIVSACDPTPIVSAFDPTPIVSAYDPTPIVSAYDPTPTKTISIDGFGEIEVGHLRRHQAVLRQAFDLKMRMTAYWKVVLRRLVDLMALHIFSSIQNLINNEMEAEIMKALFEPRAGDGSAAGSGLERLLEESPIITNKRIRLNQSIQLLKESKIVVANIIDRVAD